MPALDFEEVVTRRFGLVPYQPELSFIMEGHPSQTIKRKRVSAKDCYVTELEVGEYLSFVHVGHGLTSRSVAAQLTIDLAGGIPLNTYVGCPDWCNLITVELDEGDRNAKLARTFAKKFSLKDLEIMSGTAKGIYAPIALGPHLFMTCSIRDLRDSSEWAVFMAAQAKPLDKLTEASATKFLKNLILNNWTCLPSLAMVAYTGYEYDSKALHNFWGAIFESQPVPPLLLDFDFMYEFIEKNSSLYPEYSLKMI